MTIHFTTGAVMTGAVTDLITAILTLPMIIYLRRRNNASHWIGMFACIGGASFAGFFAHAVDWSVDALQIIWVFMYAFLLLTAYSFFMACVSSTTLCLNRAKIKKCADMVVGAAYLVVLLLHLFWRDPIRVAVVFCTLFGIAGFVIATLEAVRFKSKWAKLLLCALVPQLFGLAFQLARTGEFVLIWRFDYNSIYHLCLSVSVIIFFVSSLKQTK